MKRPTKILFPKPADDAPNGLADRPKPTRALACKAATGLTSDCESNVVRFSIPDQAQSICRQASVIALCASSLLHRATLLRDALTVSRKDSQWLPPELQKVAT